MEILFKEANEWEMDMTPLRDHSLLLRRKLYQFYLKIVDEVYKTKQEETRINEISVISTDFKTRTQEIVEIIQGQLTWLETNAKFPKNEPQKSTENLKIEYELMDFSSNAATKFKTAVGKTLDKCMDLYKKVLTTHNRCHTSTKKRLQEFSGQEECLKYLHDRLQEDELNI